MTDENLEKKTRSGLKWGCIIGAVVLATAANGFYAAQDTRQALKKGIKRALLKARWKDLQKDWLRALLPRQINQSLGHTDGLMKAACLLRFQRNVEGMGLVTYSIALNAPMIGTGEAVRIDGLDGNAVSYADNLPHDGLVDCIVNMKNGRVIGGLCRERDYGANKATFDGSR